MVYINDLHIVSPNFFFINKLKAQLALKFKIIDRGPIAHYLSMKVSQKSNTITITQIVYINQLLDMHQMSHCNPTSTLIVENLCLAPMSEDYLLYSKDVLAHKQFTGSVKWLPCQTCLNIF